MVDGQDGMTLFSNLGIDAWALQIDNLKYGDDLMSENTDQKYEFVHSKLAFIDTGNFSMQMPET